MVKKKGFNFRQKEIDCLLELTDEMLPISGKEWEDLAARHNSFFPEHDRNGDSLKRKFYSIAKKGPPTGSPNCPDYVRYAKAIMNKIAIETDGSTGSGVPGDTSENFDSEFVDADDDNEDENEDYVISSEESGLKMNDLDSFFDSKSNKPASENVFFESSNDRSKEESAVLTTSVAAGSASESIAAGSGSVLSSPAEAPKSVERKTHAFSRQFSQKRKKIKSGEESSLDKMISMMGMQMQQDFAMRRDEMKNERELRRQELAMQQQILQAQQQMMNMFMMTMMGQNNQSGNGKKRNNNDNDDQDN